MLERAPGDHGFSGALSLPGGGRAPGAGDAWLAGAGCDRDTAYQAYADRVGPGLHLPVVVRFPFWTRGWSPGILAGW